MTQTSSLAIRTPFEDPRLHCDRTEAASFGSHGGGVDASLVVGKSGKIYGDHQGRRYSLRITKHDRPRKKRTSSFPSVLHSHMYFNAVAHEDNLLDI